MISGMVFLAGPIQGADWQSEAIRLLGEHAPTLHIASPRRGVSREAFKYAAQVDWETHYFAGSGAQA
ncbi:MAG: hypothetical protein U0792_07740 [Gemmataceae bacterium]